MRTYFPNNIKHIFSIELYIYICIYQKCFFNTEKNIYIYLFTNINLSIYIYIHNMNMFEQFLIYKETIHFYTRKFVYKSVCIYIYIDS